MGDRKKEMVLEDVGTTGLLMDGESDSDSEDNAEDIEAEASRRRNKKKNKKKDNKNKRKGKLVSKIENELAKGKKDADDEDNGEEKEPEQTGIKLTSRIKRKAKDTVNVEGLRSQIQKLVQSTNPLSKCMDFVNDDIEAMNGEIDKWKGDFQKHSALLDEEERKTEEQLAPLRAQIVNVDKEVSAVLNKIQDAKARMALNDGKITEMLRFVVNHK